MAPRHERGDSAAEGEPDHAEPLGHVGVRFQQTDRTRGVGKTGLERHPRWLVIAVREPERCDTRAGERVTGRDDVWLIGMAAEAMEHRRSANRICLRQMQHAVELGVLDADSDTLRWHRSLPRRGGRRPWLRELSQVPIRWCRCETTS